MKIIGVTGGVGAGKSTVLATLKELCDCEIAMADDVAKSIMVKGGPLTKEAYRLFGEDAFMKDGNINRALLAKVIFSSDSIKKEWENLVHPATNKAINELIDRAKKANKDYFFVEAALLIENNYKSICDEIWYIYASEEDRRERLKKDRNYDDEKITRIFNAQMTDSQFRTHCDFVIDTSFEPENTRKQLQLKLEE